MDDVLIDLLIGFNGEIGDTATETSKKLQEIYEAPDSLETLMRVLKISTNSNIIQNIAIGIRNHIKINKERIDDNLAAEIMDCLFERIDLDNKAVIVIPITYLVSNYNIVDHFFSWVESFLDNDNFEMSCFLASLNDLSINGIMNNVGLLMRIVEKGLKTEHTEILKCVLVIIILLEFVKLDRDNNSYKQYYESTYLQLSEILIDSTSKQNQSRFQLIINAFITGYHRLILILPIEPVFQCVLTVMTNHYPKDMVIWAIYCLEPILITSNSLITEPDEVKQLICCIIEHTISFYDDNIEYEELCIDISEDPLNYLLERLNQEVALTLIIDIFNQLISNENNQSYATAFVFLSAAFRRLGNLLSSISDVLFDLLVYSFENGSKNLRKLSHNFLLSFCEHQYISTFPFKKMGDVLLDLYSMQKYNDGLFLLPEIMTNIYDSDSLFEDYIQIMFELYNNGDYRAKMAIILNIQIMISTSYENYTLYTDIILQKCFEIILSDNCACDDEKSIAFSCIKEIAKKENTNIDLFLKEINQILEIGLNNTEINLRVSGFKLFDEIVPQFPDVFYEISLQVFQQLSSSLLFREAIGFSSEQQSLITAYFSSFCTIVQLYGEKIIEPSDFETIFSIIDTHKSSIYECILISSLQLLLSLTIAYMLPNKLELSRTQNILHHYCEMIIIEKEYSLLSSIICYLQKFIYYCGIDIIIDDCESIFLFLFEKIYQSRNQINNDFASDLSFLKFSSQFLGEILINFNDTNDNKSILLIERIMEPLIELMKDSSDKAVSFAFGLITEGLKIKNTPLLPISGEIFEYAVNILLEPSNSGCLYAISSILSIQMFNKSLIEQYRIIEIFGKWKEIEHMSSCFRAVFENILSSLCLIYISDRSLITDDSINIVLGFLPIRIDFQCNKYILQFLADINPYISSVTINKYTEVLANILAHTVSDYNRMLYYPEQIPPLIEILLSKNQDFTFLSPNQKAVLTRTIESYQGYND